MVGVKVCKLTQQTRYKFYLFQYKVNRIQYLNLTGHEKFAISFTKIRGMDMKYFLEGNKGVNKIMIAKRMKSENQN